MQASVMSAASTTRCMDVGWGPGQAPTLTAKDPRHVRRACRGAYACLPVPSCRGTSVSTMIPPRWHDSGLHAARLHILDVSPILNKVVRRSAAQMKEWHTLKAHDQGAMATLKVAQRYKGTGRHAYAPLRERVCDLGFRTAHPSILAPPLWGSKSAVVDAVLTTDRGLHPTEVVSRALKH